MNLLKMKIKSQEGLTIFCNKLFPPLEGRMQSTSRISLVIFTSEQLSQVTTLATNSDKQ